MTGSGQALDELRDKHTGDWAPVEIEGREYRYCLHCDEPLPCATARLVARVRELEAALPDPDKLIALAEWLNIKFPNDADPEAQNDLMAWGLRIRAALDGSA